MGSNDDQTDDSSAEKTDALSISPHDSELSAELNSSSTEHNSSSPSETEDEIETDTDNDPSDIEQQLGALEQERQKILKKLKKFELEKKRKKIKKKLRKQKEKKRKKRLKEKKKARLKKKKRKRSSDSSSSSNSDSSSDEEEKPKKRRSREKKKSRDKLTKKKSNEKSRSRSPVKKSRRSRSLSLSSEVSSSRIRQAARNSTQLRQNQRRNSRESSIPRRSSSKSRNRTESRESAKHSNRPHNNSKSPIQIIESDESSPDEATPLNASLRSRLGPTKTNSKLLDDIEKRMNPIEKFHQQRSDQDITGRIINGRKIVVKTRVASPHVVLSSGQNSPNTNSPQSTQPRNQSIERAQPRNSSIERPLSERFGDSNRREDRKLGLMNPLLRKAKFFLIKSVFVENIEISQDKNCWATLPHNEKKFNQAFCEVENVFFFFIVNQTHEFRGFARMRAPAKRNEEEIRWKLPDKMKADGRSFGEVIKVDWMSHQVVPFDKVRDLRNQMNKNNPVWAGRDGQEIDSETGRDLTLSFTINKNINEHDLKKICSRSRQLKTDFINRPPSKLQNNRKRQQNNVGIQGGKRTRKDGRPEER